MLTPSRIVSIIASCALATAFACAGGSHSLHQEGARVHEARSADVLLREGSRLSLREASQLTAHMGGEEFVLVPSAHGVKVAGVGVGVGANTGRSLEGTLSDGLWWFPEGAILHDGEGYPTVLPARSLALVGSQGMNDLLFGQVSTNGGVTCKDGFYACCGQNQHGQWRAKCIQDNTTTLGGADYPTSCTNGGPGSTAYDNNTSLIPFSVVPETVNQAGAARLTPH